MLFLVDFENVHSEGMRGCNLLEAADSVTIFYSDSSKNIEKSYLQEIEDSGCRFEIVRLVRKGKNALDFYIASYLGKLFGEGEKGIGVIVSHDGGFGAVQEYWTKCASGGHKVVLAPSIEKGIQTAGGNSARAVNLNKKKQSVDIQSFYAGYRERRKLRDKIQDIFSDTEFCNQTADICQLVRSSKSAKVLYLDTLKCFGRAQGLDVYRHLKELKAQ